MINKEDFKYINLSKAGKLRVQDVPIWTRYIGTQGQFTHKGVSRYGKRMPYSFVRDVWKPILHSQDVEFFKGLGEQGRYFESQTQAPPKNERENFNFALDKSHSTKMDEARAALDAQNGKVAE